MDSCANLSLLYRSFSCFIKCIHVRGQDISQSSKQLVERGWSDGSDQCWTDLACMQVPEMTYDEP